MTTINQDGTKWDSANEETMAEAYDRAARAAYEADHQRRMEHPRKATLMTWLNNAIWIALGIFFGS